jgi:hypothetical protein
MAKTMTPELFEQLLYEDESVTLDFKEGQYAFSGADAQQKSELLKDILGFVNAWRRAEAYILIGVREVKGGKSEVIGIDATAHLDDHSLQQFVNAKANKPVRFSHEAFQLDGNHIGVIRIEEQERPVWLTSDYGKLQKDMVYVRRGSSTDITKPATPDEIIKMVEASKPQAARLEVQFADAENDAALGTSVQIEGKFIKFPSEDRIPDLVPASVNGPSLFAAVTRLSLETLNPDYYREAAKYSHHQCNFHALRFVIVNSGEVPAEDVRLELETPVSSGIEILKESQLETHFPQRTHSSISPVSSAAWKNIKTAGLRVFDGVVDVTSDSISLKLEVEYSKIQPGRQVWTDKIFVAHKNSETITLNGRVFSKNLPKPITIELSIQFSISAVEADLDHFLDWADNPTKTEEEEEEEE